MTRENRPGASLVEYRLAWRKAIQAALILVGNGRKLVVQPVGYGGFCRGCDWRETRLNPRPTRQLTRVKTDATKFLCIWRSSLRPLARVRLGSIPFAADLVAGVGAADQDGSN